MGVRFRISAEPDLTLLGAALSAGMGCGLLTDVPASRASVIIEPNPARHATYRALFESYLELQAPLRRFRKITL